jgi:hypothetical protein
VPLVGRMAVPVVQVVDMTVMGHGHVTTVRAMLMVMSGVDHMPGLAALVHMIGMCPVDVAIVGIVGVVSVLEGDMAAAVTMPVSVIDVDWMV